jgi:uncharacterized protein (DUF2147 family)
MRKLFFVLCFTILVVNFGFALDLVEGFWFSVDEKTGVKTAGWEIYADKGVLYGKMLSLFNYPQDALAEPCKDSYKDFPIAGKVNLLPVVGTPWIFGLRMDSPGRWSGGSIINAEDGKMYRCKIAYHEADGKKYKTDVLEMRGEIGMGIGRSQYWQKCTREQAGSLR